MTVRSISLLSAFLLSLSACGDVPGDGYGGGGEDNEAYENDGVEKVSDAGPGSKKDASWGANMGANMGANTGANTGWKDAGAWNPSSSMGSGQAADAGKWSSWADGGGNGGTGGGQSDKDAGWASGGDAGKDAGRADPDETEDECATLTYETFGKEFMTNYCVSCHGASNPRGGIRLDALSNVAMRKAGVKAQVLNGGMPQGNKQPTDDEREELGRWIDCGPK